MRNESIFETSRLDSSSHELLTKLSRLGADTFGYKAELSVDKDLAQLLRLRVAQINNCTYCLILHYEASRNLGIPRAKIDTLTAWWETQLFSAAEQAALAYTEALTRRRQRFLHVLAAGPSSVLRLPLDGGTGRDSGLEFVELRGGS